MGIEAVCDWSEWYGYGEWDSAECRSDRAAGDSEKGESVDMQYGGGGGGRKESLWDCDKVKGEGGGKGRQRQRKRGRSERELRQGVRQELLVPLRT